MRSVWKFPLQVTDDQDVTMPWSSHLLHVGFQGDVLMLWALVDDGVHKVRRHIQIVGTGNRADHVGEYIGTVAHAVGLTPLVWHVFDGGEVP